MMGEWWESNATHWMVPAAAIGGVLISLASWAYFKARFARSWAVICAVLKGISIALLAVCLIEPNRREEHPKPKANLVPILVDNSQSMQVTSPGETKSRKERLVRWLDHDQSWQRRLEQDFDVRRYAFDTRLESLHGFESLTFDGTASSLRTSLEAIHDRLRFRPVAGLLLFTDGNMTDSLGNAWQEIGFPVYPVIEKELGPLQDLRWSQVSVSQSDFEAAPISVSAKISGDVGMGGKVKVTLKDMNQRVVQEQLVTAPHADRDSEVHFRFRPDQSGVVFYRLEMLHEQDRADSVEKASTLEATLVNNSHLFVVHRRHGPYRVLYLSGRPNWEFKFLRRALTEDAEIELVGLIRIAKKEPKFSFRDRGVSDTNPLFAGLGNSEEEAAQQYDEPVLVRLGVTDSNEMRDGFPATAEELFEYHTIILDDIEAGFFSADQQLLLRRFVTARGGGLMMLGGQESFDGLSDSETPLADLSPVYFKDQQATITSEPPVRWQLSREGWLQPWLRLRTTEAQEHERLASMPPFETLNAVGSMKPGAAMLASGIDDEGNERPTLITQRFGNGRTAALLVGDLWRWDMRREEGKPSDLSQAWRQLIRFMVSDVPQRVEMKLKESTDITAPVTMEIAVRDEEYRPIENVNLQLKITSPSGESFPVNPMLDSEHGGVFLAEVWSRETGGYRAEVIATGLDGAEIGRAETGWAAQPAAREFEQLATNRPLLESIAESTGGRVLSFDELPRFVSDWPHDKVPVKEISNRPLWHQPWVLVAIVTCLCGEWGIRRWKGLP